MITALTVLVALGTLGWGFYRSRPDGQRGLLSWLQSVTLMAPWLLFFGMFAIGIYVNLIVMVLLFVLSTAGYMVLGRQIRGLTEAELSQQAQTLANRQAAANLLIPTDPSSTDPSSTDPSSTDPSSTNPSTANPSSTNPSSTNPSSTNPSSTDPSSTTATAAPPPGDPPTAPLSVPIPTADLTVIKGIFGVDTFFATETIPYQDGVIFNGNLRGAVEPIYNQLTTRLKDRLDDRYRLFLIENQAGKPTVVVLPSSNDPKPSTWVQNLLAVGLMLATIATSFETAGFLQGFDFYATPERYREVLPIGAGIMAILLVHELGHRIMAQRYQVKLSLPFCLPTWQIGSFGALTRFESLLPTRSALFDIAFAGPAAGGVFSLGLLLSGLAMSHSGSLFKVPTLFFEGSILVGTLAKVVLRESLLQPVVDVDPLVIIGWLGLLITAINLMPAGRLDGGRMVQAIYGRRTAGRTTAATLIVLGIVSLVNPLALYWAVVVLVVQRSLERPCLNELTEPNDARAGLALLALFLMITILLPLTPSLAGRLGIGS
jgi:membrane-associated protease RseP (regulator of RpoE activity)